MKIVSRLSASSFSLVLIIASWSWCSYGTEDKVRPKITWYLAQTPSDFLYFDPTLVKEFKKENSHFKQPTPIMKIEEKRDEQPGREKQRNEKPVIVVCLDNPLKSRIRGGNFESAITLLNHYADSNRVDYEDKASLHHLIEHTIFSGKAIILNQLNQLNQPDCLFLLKKYQAAYDLMGVLLAKNANVWLQDIHSQTVFHYVAKIADVKEALTVCSVLQHPTYKGVSLKKDREAACTVLMAQRRKGKDATIFSQVPWRLLSHLLQFTVADRIDDILAIKDKDGKTAADLAQCKVANAKTDEDKMQCAELVKKLTSQKKETKKNQQFSLNRLFEESTMWLGRVFWPK
jgi:hypothetical protein